MMRWWLALPVGIPGALAAQPICAQDIASYPVPTDTQARAIERDLPAVVGALEEKIVADCEAAGLGGGSCVEVLAWAADRHWSDPDLRMDYARRAVDAAERFLPVSDPRRAVAYTAMAHAADGSTTEQLNCPAPCPLFAAAEPWFARAVSVLEGATPRDHLALAMAYRLRADNLYQQGRDDEGERFAQLNLATLSAGLPATYARLRTEIEDRLYTLETERQLYAEAEAEHRRRIAATTQVEGESETLAIDLADFAMNLTNQGRYEDAGNAAARALAVIEAALGADLRRKLDVYQTQATVFEAMGEDDQATATLREIIRIADQFGEDRNYSMAMRVRLAVLLDREGRHEEAQPLLMEAYVHNPDDLTMIDALAKNFASLGEATAAAGLYRKAIERTDEDSGIDAVFVDMKRAYLRMGLGAILLQAGEVEEAESELEKGVAEWQRMIPWHTTFLDLRILLAEAKARRARGDDALAQLSAASALTATLLDPANPLRVETDRRAARLLDTQLDLPPSAWTFYDRAAKGAKARIDSYTSFDGAARRELQSYRPLFLNQVGAAWRFAERASAP